MNKLLLLLSIPLLSIPQQTYVPDNNFEAYLENNGMGNGTPYDDYVTTKNINTITYLDVSMGAESNTGIFDLTGIEYFTNLTELDCSYNQLTELNVSQNIQLTFVWCTDNEIDCIQVWDIQSPEQNFWYKDMMLYGH